MNNVDFEENNFDRGFSNSGTNIQSQTGSKMGDWLINNGIATSPQSANIILLIIGLLIFIISIYVFVYGFNLPSSNQTIDSELFPPGLEL
jgi:hypothetical protein